MKISLFYPLFLASVLLFPLPSLLAMEKEVQDKALQAVACNNKIPSLFDLVSQFLLNLYQNPSVSGEKLLGYLYDKNKAIIHVPYEITDKFLAYVEQHNPDLFPLPEKISFSNKLYFSEDGQVAMRKYDYNDGVSLYDRSSNNSETKEITFGNNITDIQIRPAQASRKGQLQENSFYVLAECEDKKPWFSRPLKAETVFYKVNLDGIQLTRHFPAHTTWQMIENDNEQERKQCLQERKQCLSTCSLPSLLAYLAYKNPGNTPLIREEIEHIVGCEDNHHLITALKKVSKNHEMLQLHDLQQKNNKKSKSYNSGCTIS